MQKRDIIQANASLDNLRKNLEIKEFAKEILLEENYTKFMKSYKFTFWLQLLGVSAGFVVPSVVLLIIFKDIAYCAFGAVIRNSMDVYMASVEFANSPNKNI